LFIVYETAKTPRPLAETEMHFAGKGISKRAYRSEQTSDLFHNGTHGSIPNSAKPANAFFPSFLAGNS
jgi:hypothetical protein